MNLQIPKLLKKVRTTNFLPKDLVQFEKDVIEHYENKLIRSPIHLSGNNEKQLIKIFQYIDK